MMKKRIVPALLCFILLFWLFTPTAHAENKVKTPIADIVLYADKKAEVGSEVVVEIYIENITLKNGVIGDDLPMTYDRDRLSLLAVDAVFPKEWKGYGEYFGMDIDKYDPMTDDYPYWLRSFPDVPNGEGDVNDLFTDPVYRIKKSKAIGYKVRFKALSAGEAFVAVESDFANNRPIMLVVIEKVDDKEDDVQNYGANGMTLKIDIAEESASQAPPATSDDDSSAAIPPPVVSSVEPPSAEVSSVSSTEPSSAEESSAEPPSGEPSGEPSEVDPSSADLPPESALPDISADESSDAPAEVTENSGDEDDNGGEKKNAAPWVIAAVVILAVGAGAAGIVIYRKSKEA